jgi:transposase-like protein
MLTTPKGAALDTQGGPTSTEQECLVEQLRTRNAELENTNRLLLDQIAESRRAEMARRPHSSPASLGGR